VGKGINIQVLDADSVAGEACQVFGDNIGKLGRYSAGYFYPGFIHVVTIFIIISEVQHVSRT
jgi:hypothetical protein